MGGTSSRTFKRLLTQEGYHLVHASGTVQTTYGKSLDAGALTRYVSLIAVLGMPLPPVHHAYPQLHR